MPVFVLALAQNNLYHVVIYTYIINVNDNYLVLSINKGRCIYSGLFTPLQSGITQADVARVYFTLTTFTWATGLRQS